MKHTDAPVCPRCNRNDEVRKIMDDRTAAARALSPVRDGYMLEGIVIRPDSSDWYCALCSQTFGTARLYWGKFLSERMQ